MSRTQRFRLLAIVGLVAVLTAGISVRLYQLQVVEHGRLRQLAEGQHRKQIKVTPRRGSILDRQGRELAVSVESERVYAQPSRVTDPPLLATRLSALLDVPEAELLGKLSSSRPFVYLKRFLDPQTAERVRQLRRRSEDSQAFDLLPDSRRVYPEGKLAAHLLGFASREGHGLEGLERVYDAQLSGQPATYLVRVDARAGRLSRHLQRPAEVPRDLVLTLDAALQRIVERELEAAMRATGARAASAILLDPTSGDVLALANRPTLDPNHYGRATSAQKVNRALTNIFEPGSTFKFVPMVTALDRGTVRGGQRIDCEGGRLRRGSRIVRDISPHQLLELGALFAASSNIGMVKVTETLPNEALYESIRAFGFGSRTGIGLPESRGLLRGPAEWSSFSRDSLAFGQEIGVTVPQLATALGVIANEGVRVAPRIVLGTRARDGELERTASPVAERVVSARAARLVRDMMERVVAEGTGTRAQVTGYRIAGKSGTAQKSDGSGYSATNYFASFGGFAPVRQPRLVALVVLDSPQGERTYGGQVAAPVFARIMEQSLRRLAVPYDTEPQRNVARAERQPRSAAVGAASSGTGREQPGRVPDVRGLSASRAVARLATAGCGSRLDGSGLVHAQHPPAGRPLPADGVCRLALRSTPLLAAKIREGAP